jgi:glycosyltransferase involved in cell wall biosynthesis
MTYMHSYESALSHVGADIYIQVCAGRPTGYVADFCKKRGKPFIFRATSLWDADLTFKWGWKSWRDYTKEVYLQGVRQADIVAANSENTARMFVDHIGKEKVRFLPDGFHMPPCPDLLRRDGYVLWVGRDAPYKRPQLFADLARMLPKYRFVMVGDIRSMNSPPANLLLLGPKKPDELSEIYSQAGLLVNTSEVEGFPNVLVEAGIHGVPYIGFLDPDNVVREYSLGLHARSLDEMARMTETLMDSQDLRFALGKNARRFAEERHDIRKVTEKWLLLFEEMTGRQ